MATLTARTARLRLPGAGTRLGRWVALHLEDRRRNRVGRAPAPPAPVITGGGLVVSEVDPLWLDAIVNFTFDGTGLPAGALEVQGCLGSAYGAWETRLTVPVGATQFRDDMIFTNQNDVYYRMRFVSDSVTGPFSDEYLVML
jgi:hypothetical protein